MMSPAQLKQIKIHSRMSIPTGRYVAKMSFSNRFQIMLPERLNVPGFQGIRIHKGHYVGNTDGCLLPGSSFDQDKLGYFRVWNSKVVFDPLLADIKAAELRKEPIFCEISRLYKL